MKNSILSIGIIVLLALTGCIDLEVTDHIQRDGTSITEAHYDLSAFKGLAGMQNMMGGPADPEEPDFANEMAKMCDTMAEDTARQGAELVSCETTEDYHVYATTKQSVKDRFSVEKGFPYITYTYQMMTIDEAMAQLEERDMDDRAPAFDFSGEGQDLKQAKAGAEMIGMKATYTVIMPGTITSTTIGEVEGNQVTMNMFDTISNERQVVTSQELNMTWLLVIGGGVLLLLILVVVLVVVMMRR